MARPKKQKPFVAVQETSVFGEVDQDMLDREDGKDIFELPGYSDLRREFDLARRKGERVPPMPFRAHLVRMMGATGIPDQRKVAERIRQGYKTVSPEELEALTGHKMWDEDGRPLTSYQKGPDNTVRLNENVVMVADRATAARNLARVERRTRAQEEDGLHRTVLSGKDGIGQFAPDET